MQLGRSVTALWLVQDRRWPPTVVPLSFQDETCAASLPRRRALQFRRSRAWLRHCLATRFQLAVDAIPLQAPSGQPPRLPEGWGYVSLSHSGDALLIAWSAQPIGVDLERADRRFAAEALASRFYCDQDRFCLAGLPLEQCRSEVLRQWLAKEAAIKWQGGALATDLVHWSWSGQQEMATHLDLALSVRIHQLAHQDWWMAVAANTRDIAGQAPPLCLA